MQRVIYEFIIFLSILFLKIFQFFKFFVPSLKVIYKADGLSKNNIKPKLHLQVLCHKYTLIL